MMNESDLDILWIGAFRYYLGRRTHAVSDFCHLLLIQWNSLPTRTKTIIQHELSNAFLRDDDDRDKGLSHLPLGADCDRAEWEKVKVLLDWENGLSDEQKEILLISKMKKFIAYQNRPVHIDEVLSQFPSSTKVMIEENFYISKKGFIEFD
jgi:hypothetical protein